MSLSDSKRHRQVETIMDQFRELIQRSIQRIYPKINPENQSKDQFRGSIRRQIQRTNPKINSENQSKDQFRESIQRPIQRIYPKTNPENQSEDQSREPNWDRFDSDTISIDSSRQEINRSRSQTNFCLLNLVQTDEDAQPHPKTGLFVHKGEPL
jgi:hypothetical protein